MGESVSQLQPASTHRQDPHELVSWVNQSRGYSGSKPIGQSLVGGSVALQTRDRPLAAIAPFPRPSTGLSGRVGSPLREGSQ